MYYKRARLGTKVEVVKDIDQCASGTIGTIIELRGYNFDGQKVVGRWVHVWTENGRNVSVTTELLREVK